MTDQPAAPFDVAGTRAYAKEMLFKWPFSPAAGMLLAACEEETKP